MTLFLMSHLFDPHKATVTCLLLNAGGTGVSCCGQSVHKPFAQLSSHVVGSSGSIWSGRHITRVDMSRQDDGIGKSAPRCFFKAFSSRLILEWRPQTLRSRSREVAALTFCGHSRLNVRWLKWHDGFASRNSSRTTRLGLQRMNFGARCLYPMLTVSFPGTLRLFCGCFANSDRRSGYCVNLMQSLRLPLSNSFSVVFVLIANKIEFANC